MRIMVTGGAGYVGSVLVPKLLADGHEVRVLDLFLYGETLASHPKLDLVHGDLRDLALVRHAVRECDTVIHLACISNDPSFELDPGLGKSINLDAFEPLVRASEDAGVRRFVYASSSSVYGVSEALRVDESHPLLPLTDYSKFKADCEPILLDRASERFVPVVVRPATVCGYSPRQRLDLTINILTNHAFHNQKITVFGGDQQRPNIHIDDMVDVYRHVLALPDERVRSQVFNAGYENRSVAELAQIVKVTAEREGLGEIAVVTTPTNDPRSYRIDSEKMVNEIGYRATRSYERAIQDLIAAFREGKLPNAMTDSRYFNVKRMQEADALRMLGGAQA